MGSNKRTAGAVIGLLLLLQSLDVSAQTWGEWFNQKKTQISYYTQQIAALQIYIGYARKGYQIAGDGLHTVSDLTNGEFSLHKTYFASLSAVNPAIKNSDRVAEIVRYQQGIIAALNSWKPDGWNEKEWQYLLLVRSGLLADCGKDMDDLQTLLKAGQLEMTDEERLKRLDVIWKTMQGKAVFAQSFTGQLMVFKRQRNRDEQDVNQIQKLYEKP